MCFPVKWISLEVEGLQENLKLMARGFLATDPTDPYSVVLDTNSGVRKAQPCIPGTHVPILYEDEYLWIVNKPKGMYSVSDADTVPDNCLDRLARRALVNDRENGCIPDQEIVLHRLDRWTSGCIMLCKSPSYYEIFRELFHQHRIDKTYLAPVTGEFMGPRRLSAYIWLQQKDGNFINRVNVQESRPTVHDLHGSIATYRTTFFQNIDYEPDRRLTLVRATTSSASRHQIRAFSAYLGHPLVGDRKYGAVYGIGTYVEHGGQIPADPSHYDGFLLHAESIAFNHPLTGEYIKVVAGVGEPFSQLFQSEGK